MNQRSIVISTAIVLVASGCAPGFKKPATFDEAPVRARAVTAEKDGIRASATLLKHEEIVSIFGVDLTEKEIQPVWLEVENGRTHPVLFLISGADPEYFSPLEVAHAFHSKFAADSRDRLDDHIVELTADYRRAIAPGSAIRGFVYTNQSERTKVVDIDLLGNQWMTSLSLFVPDASQETSQLIADVDQRLTRAVGESGLVSVENEEELREAIASLPCCARNAAGDHVAPLNMVVIGELDQWVSGVQRRGYRYREVDPLYALGRAQDASCKKIAKWVDAQPHALRFWQTPLRYGSMPVWLVQASTPRGGRFSKDDGPVDPFADHARDAIVEDLLYCQNLAKLGFVTGAGCAEGASKGITTDGLRYVLVFDDRSISLAEIEFFDWERLVDHR